MCVYVLSSDKHDFCTYAFYKWDTRHFPANFHERNAKHTYSKDIWFTVIYCHLHVHVGGIVVRPIPADITSEFKHACLVFGKRAFVFSDTVESNRNIARSFLSSWERFFSTWRKGPSGFSAWRKSLSDVPIALNDGSDVSIALNDVRWMMERVLSYQYMYLTHVLKKLQLELNFNSGSHRTIHLVYIWYFIEELTTKSKEWKRNVALKLMTRACI